MKLVIILITVACLQVSASALAQKITLNEKDASLEKIFNDIKQQTGYNFFYEHNILNGTSKVTIKVKDANLEDVLNQCLSNQQLVYTIAGKNIGVKKKENQPIQTTAPAPPKDVTGQVLDKNGIPLVSATVLIKRTKKGVLTDVKGNFTLHDVLPTDVIVVTYIGYKPLESTVGDKTVFNLSMTEATNSLDQVVIQAYGKTSQRLATGDIATVTAKEIENQPVTNPLAAMIGKVPGLIITQTNGYASAPFKVEIRGRSQINPNLPSEPLFIIDGVPLTTLENPDAGGNYKSGSVGVTQNGMTGPAGGQSPLFSLNPNDIESISVLKDADATAIYGSRGANGVILIKTKSGQAGKTKLDATSTYGLDVITQRHNLMNTAQYLEMRREAFKNNGIQETPFNAYDLLIYNQSRYTDWQKYLLGNVGRYSNSQLSLSGGDKSTTYRISGTYVRETPILKGGYDQKANVQVALDQKSLNQKLRFSLRVNYAYITINEYSLPTNTVLAPNAPEIYLPNGQLNWNGWARVFGHPNPFGATLTPYNSNTGFLNSHLDLSYEIIKGLQISTSFGYSTTNGQGTQFTPITSQDPTTNPRGSSAFGNNLNRNSIIEPQISYTRKISKGTLDALVGSSIQSVTQNGNTLYGNGYLDDALLGSIANAPSVSGGNSTAIYKYYAVVFGRVNYIWDDKYIINLSARRDGSTRFGPGKQYGNFGSVGAAWILSEEQWFKNIFGFLSFAKLRGSYGTTGSDNIPNYQFLSAWTDASLGYKPGNAAYENARFFNPNLQWQVNKKLEVAADLSFIKDRLNLEVSWYRNRIGNQLVDYNLPAITGFNTVTANLDALLQNTGFESTINAKIIDKTAFNWSVNFDIGINHNKLVAFPNLAQSPYSSVYVVGQSLDIVKLLHYTGVDPQTGQYTFQDKNKDGQIIGDFTNPKNDLFTYNLDPKFNGGFGTDLKYKGLQLSLFFHFVNQRVPSVRKGAGYPGMDQNQTIEALNRWQHPGDIAQFARYTTQPALSDSNFGLYSDGLLSDGSYIRLQNAALSYDLPERWVHQIGFSNAKIFFRGENLFLITKYDGFDPDIPGFGSIPPTKSFTAGLQFNL